MADINPRIFKRYDIRGRAEGDDAPVSAETARVIGHGFGTYAQRFEGKTTVVVGRDNRQSSFTLAQAAVSGLRASGCRVIDIGLVSTPLVYWHAVHHDQAGGLMVTGSHLPPEQNGFKLTIGSRNVYGDQIGVLRRLIEQDKFAYGDGVVELDEAAYSRYVRDLTRRVAAARPLRVVVDAGSGTAGLFAPALLKRWGHELVECMFCQPDGRFPHHQPDPSQPENMQALGDTVRKLNADIGVAFDGDADRMGVVDETGAILVADRLLALLARDLLSRQPGALIVGDVMSSQVLFDEIRRAGGQPVMWSSGHSVIKARMAELNAPLGGEMSGHIFLGEDYFGFDDAFLAAGRFLSLVANSGMRLSELNATMPTLFSTPQYRPHCPDELKESVIRAVKADLMSKGEITEVDGIRIQFENGWGSLRASNTEPVLSLRFEGVTEGDALRYRAWFAQALARFPQVGALE